MGQWLHALVVLFTLVAGQSAQIVVRHGERHAGNLATVSDSIRVDGEVTGDVTSWSGDIVVAGRVDGDVVSYTGNVTIAPDAQVAGSALALAGRLNVAQRNALAGQAISGGAGGQVVNRVAGLFGSSPYLPAGIANLSRLLLSGVIGALLLGLSVMFLAAWPQRSNAAGLTLRAMLGRALLAGLLVTCAVLTLGPLVGLLLATTILGAPLALILVLLVNLLCINGLAVLIQAARQTLDANNSVTPLASAALIAAALVAPIVLLALISPLLALGAFYLLSAPGLGALILSRGGTIAPVRA
jgi:hypothetical protein